MKGESAAKCSIAGACWLLLTALIDFFIFDPDFLLKYLDASHPPASRLVLSSFMMSLLLAEWGSTKTGEQEQLILTALNCVLRVPRYVPQEQRFDVRVLVRPH